MSERPIHTASELRAMPLSTAWLAAFETYIESRPLTGYRAGDMARRVKLGRTRKAL